MKRRRPEPFRRATGRRRGWPHCAESGLLPPSRSPCPTARCRPRSCGVGTTGAGRRVLSDGPQTRARTHARTDGRQTTASRKRNCTHGTACYLPLCFVRNATVPAGAPHVRAYGAVRVSVIVVGFFRFRFVRRARGTTRSAFLTNARNGERNDDGRGCTARRRPSATTQNSLPPPPPPGLFVSLRTRRNSSKVPIGFCTRVVKPCR